MKEHSRKNYARNKDKIVERTVEYFKRLRSENPAKFRAKKFFDVKRDGVALDVTKEYLEGLFRSTEHCQCCGKKLCLKYEERETRRHRSNPDAPSVDRVNNQKEYTRSNIAIICWECNFRKTDLTLQDLEMMASYIRKFGDLGDVL